MRSLLLCFLGLRLLGSLILLKLFDDLLQFEYLVFKLKYSLFLHDGWSRLPLLLPFWNMTRRQRGGPGVQAIS